MIDDFGFCDNKLYNADETGLYWKMLPENAYVALSEKTAPGLKIAKQLLTLLGCANATALHKLNELVIGKSNNLRYLKNISNPMIYKNSKYA